MTRSTITGGALVTALAVLVIVLVVRDRSLEPGVEPTAATPPGVTSAATATEPATEVHPGLLYGRITTVDHSTYEGRLRWGGDQEAFWGDYFEGTKPENPWAVHAPRDGSPLEIFGFAIGGGERPNFGRPFMTRFGDIARIEARFGDVQVTLKSGTMFVLDRFSAGDIDDGVRVWDVKHGVVDLDTRQIRTIE